MLKLYFYILQIFQKFRVLKQVIKIKALGTTKTNELDNLLLAILSHSQDFLWKLPKLVKICNCCIAYLINFGTKFSFWSTSIAK